MRKNLPDIGGSGRPEGRKRGLVVNEVVQRTEHGKTCMVQAKIKAEEASDAAQVG